MKTLWLALLLAGASHAADRITGIVVDAITNRPLPRVRVGLSSADARDRERAAVTAADGSFRFDSLAPGKYMLVADHPSGIRQYYGQPEMAAPGYGIAVVTGPDLKSEGIVFRLFPPCAIHGRITDQAGEAVEGVLAQLFRVLVARGKRTGYYYGAYRTNDIGEYRFGPLPAGTYYLLATGRPWYTDRLRNEADSPLARMGYAPVFYPNARDARGAAPLRVRAGQDAAADFVLTALPAGKLIVTRKVPGEPTPDPAAPDARFRRRYSGPAARFEITFDGPAGSIGWERVEWLYAESTYAGVPQGRYTLKASTTDPAKPLYGRAEVLVGAGDTTVEMPLMPAPVVTGTLRMTGADRTIPRGTILELENESESRHIRRPVEADGSFAFDSVPPGEYAPLLISPTQALRVTAVALDGRPAQGLSFDVSRPLRLDVTAVAKASEVSGFVYRMGVPQAGVHVLLVPRREGITPHDVVGFVTDSDGSFEFEAVIEGEYRLVPIEDYAEIEYANIDALGPFLPLAQDVRVEAGREKQTVRIETEVELT